MSAYSEQTTEFKDADVLCEALASMGVKGVQRHAVAQPLEGYQGDKRDETAEIIIPRKYVGGASNDIGFKRSPSGSYSAVISQFDSSRYNAQWLKKLKATYAEGAVMKQAAKGGLRFTGKKKVNGKVQLQFVKV